MQAYCFRFYFLLVTVIILQKMVSHLSFRRSHHHQIGWDQSHRHRSNRAWRPREKLSLTGILGQIRFKNMERCNEKHFPKSYHWRYGWIWKSWCRDVLHPVTDSFRLWLSGMHCRLGSWRWRISKNASFTTVNARSGGLWIISKTNCIGETCCNDAGERCKCKACTQLITREEKAWCQVRRRNREHRRHLLQCCHQGTKNLETNSRVLFSNTLTRQIANSVRDGVRRTVPMSPRECLRVHTRDLRDCAWPCALQVLSLTGSRTRCGAYGVVRAMRRILHPCAVLSMMRRRNSIDYSSELRDEVQGNVHAWRFVRFRRGQCDACTCRGRVHAWRCCTLHVGKMRHLIQENPQQITSFIVWVEWLTPVLDKQPDAPRLIWVPFFWTDHIERSSYIDLGNDTELKSVTKIDMTRPSSSHIGCGYRQEKDLRTPWRKHLHYWRQTSSLRHSWSWWLLHQSESTRYGLTFPGWTSSRWRRMFLLLLEVLF